MTFGGESAKNAYMRGYWDGWKDAAAQPNPTDHREMTLPENLAWQRGYDEGYSDAGADDE